MEDLSYTGLTTGIALLAYYYTLMKAGAARGKFGVQAPSHDGPDEYLRYVRAHQNTLEHIVIFFRHCGYFLTPWTLFGERQ